MPIVVHENTKVFHLYNRYFSYIIDVLRNGQIGQLYFGAPLRDRENFTHMQVNDRRDMDPCVYEGDQSFSLEDTKQEYPVTGNGDLRNMAATIVNPDGSRYADFTYASYAITPGKPKLDGLPATYVEHDDEAETLTITLVDHVTKVELELSYTLYADRPVLARNARFVNHGETTVTLDAAMSVNIDLSDARWTMLDFTGAWGRERHLDERPLHTGVQSIYSLRGHSSHQFNPFLILKRPETTEEAGECFGVSLVYSGNFLGQVEVDNYHVTRLMMGIHPEGFAWPLKPGDAFQTPEAVIAYSADGLNAMSQAYHSLYRTRLARGYWRDRPRPVLINSWESTYMRFDEDKLYGIAAKAHELGVDLFVLDDGWFGHRDNDESSLGDWFADPKKLPNGVEGLARRITSLGMQFGLWFEPEMISKDSKLYKAHPDWMIRVPDRTPLHGRNQFELDFTKPEVVDYIAEQMEKILGTGLVSYVKWDMNRSMTDVFSQGRPAEFQGEVYHRQILGVYALYERLTAKFPKVLFESCASGGGRFDAGMLYYAPQGWISDDSDAIERLKIQYGTSFGYPISSMGSHVSAVPNHQVFRRTPLKTRADVAYFGTFGYELDVNKIPPEEQEEIRGQIAFFKEHYDLIAHGTFYRLISPYGANPVGLQEGAETAWMVVSEDRSRALVGYYRAHQPVNEGYRSLRLDGLDPDREYTVKDTAYRMPQVDGERFYGDELMRHGFDVSDSGFGPWTTWIYQGDYQSRLFEITAC
ncbi:alpha-galactosidase [Bifidobacterium ramosum]|uniref:Alpha-galactosidase n=1 Tax=Bifidobacterium ramosum TaxID=1798158 RepID=A0A6L4X2D4_9BIFI|nr:alpha-galactosidase [Bifidobacterium ramosum]KAB8289050.1 alpha-galactosidase [Bifidobacterium ramosum]NEG70764.1 alpha-galactosidase [Bifidobacterium ramosum]